VTKEPSDAAVIFLLSEHVRQEVGGKVSVLGLYPGNLLLIPKDTKQIVVPLTFIFIALEGEGVFPTSLSVHSPSGKPMFPDASLSDSIKNPREALSVFVAVQPFVTEETGKFDVTLRLGKSSYRRSFTIEFAP
jgi:hypothetical protein